MKREKNQKINPEKSRVSSTPSFFSKVLPEKGQTNSSDSLREVTYQPDNPHIPLSQSAKDVSNDNRFSAYTTSSDYRLQVVFLGNRQAGKSELARYLTSVPSLVNNLTMNTRPAKKLISPRP